MVKIVRYYPPGVPAWQRLPQWEERPDPVKTTKDADMEGIELAMKKNLVLPRTSQLKRTRTDSIFGAVDESPVKRARVPELRRAQSEQVPALNRLTSLTQEDTGHNHSIQLRFDQENGWNIDGTISTTPPQEPAPPQKNLSPEHLALSNEPPSLANHFLAWRSTHKISTQHRPRWATPSEKSHPDYAETTTLDTEHLALCYALGERLQDTDYRNAILHTFRRHALAEKLFPSDRAVAIIYASTEKGSPARRMMVDFWAYVGDAGWLEGEGGVGAAVCPEFLEDLVGALLSVRGKPGRRKWPWVEGAEAYLLGEELWEDEGENEGAEEDEPMEM